mmetsp:Transcript_66619/g.159212  ORF Transcript_66619/g.159212 Transcript_66619/m.159212 type:complete len:237 (+) Transcript_66619:1025-1735(+)
MRQATLIDLSKLGNNPHSGKEGKINISNHQVCVAVVFVCEQFDHFRKLIGFTAWARVDLLLGAGTGLVGQPRDSVNTIPHGIRDGHVLIDAENTYPSGTVEYTSILHPCLDQVQSTWLLQCSCNFPEGALSESICEHSCYEVREQVTPVVSNHLVRHSSHTSLNQVSIRTSSLACFRNDDLPHHIHSGSLPWIVVRHGNREVPQECDQASQAEAPVRQPLHHSICLKVCTIQGQPS